MISACTRIHTFFTHSALCHPLKTVASGYGLAPPLCYHSPVPLLSVSLVGPLSCIWDLMCACVCGVGCRVNVSSPRPCVTMTLCGFCLFLVWRLTVSYIVSLYGHCHWKFLYSVCVCVLAFVCLHECKPLRESTLYLSSSALSFNLLLSETKHSRPQSHIQEQTFLKPPLTVSVTPSLLHNTPRLQCRPFAEC